MVQTQRACLPIAQRTTEVGCWITATTQLGVLPAQEVFWYLDSFPNRSEAEAVRGRWSTVVESSSTGARIAEIGPLSTKAGVDYTAEYMESVFTPGMTAPAHRHSGPEAWYTLTGEPVWRPLRRKSLAGQVGNT